MPKKTDDIVSVRIYTLRQEGLAVDGIVSRLHLEFNKNVVPDRSTVARHVKRLESVPQALAQEDLMFQWGATPGPDWVHGRLLLDLWAFMETLNYPVTLTRRLAKWVCRVSQAAGPGEALFSPTGGGSWYAKADQPEERVIDAPSESDLVSMSMEYAWRETAELVLGRSFETSDLDIWLAFSPWKGINWLQRFHEAKGRRSIPPVKWHLSDQQRASSALPVPVSAFPALGEPPTEVVRLLNDYWVRATDGLLTSQVHHYRSARGTNGSKAQRRAGDGHEPWYFQYLDQIAAAGAAGVQQGISKTA